MESQPQNPKFRNNPENFHPCTLYINLILQAHDPIFQFHYLIVNVASLAPYYQE